MQETMLKLAQWAVGQTGFGFELVKKEEVKAIAATVYTLRHVKTGAQLLYTQRASENKTFGIAFETLPENHTGVFHILEHSVLCGSKKYPVKEPFVSLLQSSMQTFLNAMTYGDKTVYPVSSRNEQDFHNLMGVYLDAVFNPAIYDKPEIFQQEGWHFEVDDNGQPSYNGVVFSEMKGAMSSVDRLMMQEAETLLFPDSCYHFNSGGDPRYIPDLTYDEFINTHKRFYHPSNAKIFLDGDMAVESVLAFIDEEYLSKYDRREKDFFMVEQKPVSSAAQVAFQPAPGSEDKAHLTLAKILCKFDEYEKIYAAQVLCDYLTGSNEAPLQRAILEAGLGQEASAEFSDGIYQPFAAFVVRNTTADKFDAIAQKLQETAVSLANGGMDKQALLASLERLAFRCREIKEPFGLILGLQALDSWLYGGDPTKHWDTEPIFASLRQKLEGDYFEKLLLEMFGDVSQMCRVEMLPSMTKGEEDAAAERQRLDAAAAAWDEEKRAQVAENARQLLAWQQTPDSPENLAKLPKLSLSDIPKEPARIETALTNVEGRPLLRVETDTHGISYVNLFFSLADFTTEELQMVKVMTLVLGQLSTRNLPAAQLQSQVKTWLGSFRTRVEAVGIDGDMNAATPYLVVSGSMLEENAHKALDLMGEILTGTVFTEAERLGEILKQTQYELQQSVISSGHSYAMTKALAPFTAEGTLAENLSGETFVHWLKALTEGFEQEGQNVMQALEALYGRCFTRSRLSVGSAGALAEEKLAVLLSRLEAGGEVVALKREAQGAMVSAVEIPSQVNYAGFAHNLYAMGLEYTGSAAVLSSIMSYAYLWNAVRVQGGAYGTGLLVRPNGDLGCYSYRDPNPQGAIAAFKGMADFLEGFCNSDASLDELIIGTIGHGEPLMAPGEICQLAMGRYLKGKTYADACKLRAEMISTTKDDLRKLIPALRQMAQSGAVCVVGGKENIAFLNA